MLRRILAGILVLAFLVSVGGSVNVYAAISSSRSDNGGMATGDVPIGVQMDRAPADVPRAQISSPLLSILPCVEIVSIRAERLVTSVVVFEPAVRIIEQQHVFRI